MFGNDGKQSKQNENESGWCGSKKKFVSGFANHISMTSPM